MGKTKWGFCGFRGLGDLKDFPLDWSQGTAVGSQVHVDSYTRAIFWFYTPYVSDHYPSVPRYADFSALVLILEKIRNDTDLCADSKILLILLLLFGKNTRNSVVRHNMIKVCLLKNKLNPNEHNTDSQIHPSYFTTDHNATMQNQNKNCLPEDV